MAGYQDRARSVFARTASPVGVLVAGVSACTIASLITYRPRLHDYFVFDDFIWLRAVRNHPFLEVMHRGFTFPNASPFDEVTLFWRPLADLYFYAARPLGLDPAPFHGVNFLAHAMVGGLAILLIWRLHGNLAAGAVSGLLFVMAPTYDFAVVWISQISELFGASAVLGALLTYRLYLIADERPARFLWATLGFVILGFLAKESTVIVIGLLPALAASLSPLERRRGWREVAMSLGPILLLGAVFGVFMLVYQLKNDNGSYEIGPHMVRNIGDYLRWMVLPFDFGSHELARSILATAFVAAGLLATLLRQRSLAFLFVWTMIALVLFSGFSFGIELRYTYLATIPFVAFVVTGAFTVAKAAPAKFRVPTYAVLGIAIAMALIVTPMRTRDFQQFIEFQADGYQRMVDAVTHLCGPMSPGTQVYLRGVPYHDMFGTATSSAVNLHTEGVRAYVVDEYPDLIAFVQDKCVLQFDRASWRYNRVTDF